jgi:hypothetical protein
MPAAWCLQLALLRLGGRCRASSSCRTVAHELRTARREPSLQPDISPRVFLHHGRQASHHVASRRPAPLWCVATGATCVAAALSLSACPSARVYLRNGDRYGSLLSSRAYRCSGLRGLRSNDGIIKYYRYHARLFGPMTFKRSHHFLEIAIVRRHEVGAGKEHVTLATQ